MSPKDRSFYQESMDRLMLLCMAILIGFFVLSIPVTSWGHGLAGKRFFPTTLAVDDPFVSDELSFLISYIKEPGGGVEPATKSTEISLDYSKRITPNLGISVGESFRYLKPDDGKSKSGFGNLELGLKYQFFTSEQHEAILSVGLQAEIGGTGTRRVGAESFSVISPLFFFGKGFGDLPESIKFLRPLAITGAIGPNFPTRSRNVTTTLNEKTGDIEQEIEGNPTTLTWGFSIAVQPSISAIIRERCWPWRPLQPDDRTCGVSLRNMPESRLQRADNRICESGAYLVRQVPSAWDRGTDPDQ